MTARQGVCRRVSRRRTSSNRRGGTASNRPPLVCASVRSNFCCRVALFQSVTARAVFKFCCVPPGIQSCAIRSKISSLIAGTAAAFTSALTPLARQSEAR